MKKQYLIYLLLALPLAGLTSCLFDQEDLFDESASERIEAWKMEVKSVLESADNGWHCRYFPDEDLTYGGYNLFFKFDGTKGEATLASEIEDDPSYTETCLYSFGEDQGVTVNFDTKSSILNYFCHPVNSDLNLTYKGMNGDYMFEVVSATPEEVVMKGTVTTNLYVMEPIPVGTTWEEEMSTYKNAANEYIFDSYWFEVNGTRYEATLSYNCFRVLLDESTSSYLSVPFIYTKTGISFYQPTTIDGITAQDLDLNDPEMGYYFSANEGQSFRVMTPTPKQSDNTFTVTVTNIKYNGEVTVNVTPTNSDYYYITYMTKAQYDTYKSTKAILSVMTGELNDDIGYGEDIEAIMKSRSHTGSDSQTFNHLTFADHNYVALVCGCDVDDNGESILSTTTLYTQEFSLDSSLLSSAGAEDDYYQWIGRWKITSASSETTFSQYTFYVTVNPDVVNSTFWTTGWGYCQITDEAILAMQYNARDIAGSIGLAGNQYMDIWYSDVREYYLRTRLQSISNPGNFTSGSSTNVYLTATHTGTNTAEMVGRNWNTSYNSSGAEFFLYDYEKAASYWVGSGYVKSGYTYQDIFVEPFSWEKIVDIDGNDCE